IDSRSESGEAQFNEFKNQFPDRQAKVAQFLEGPTYTLNCCISHGGVYAAGLSYQITGITELTPYEGGTIGNDFSCREGFQGATSEKINHLVDLVGAKLIELSYKGFFGLDFIVSEGEPKLIEINARQPASVSFVNKIQLRESEPYPISELHLLAFADNPGELPNPVEYNEKWMKAINYSQITVRNVEESFSVNWTPKLGSYRLQSDNSAYDFEIDASKEDVIYIDEDQDKPLIPVDTSYAVDQIDAERILVLPRAELGSHLELGDEICKLQLPSSAVQLDHTNKIQIIPWIREALIALREHMR
ncbi:MAG: ATP-grasp domain-containing protein, partial [Bdellovibrionales bacterium]|nr:ATP-grasp domain-containing protein [Bdellovibrionales bacterium]